MKFFEENAILFGKEIANSLSFQPQTTVSYSSKPKSVQDEDNPKLETNTKKWNKIYPFIEDLCEFLQKTTI